MTSTALAAALRARHHGPHECIGPFGLNTYDDTKEGTSPCDAILAADRIEALAPVPKMTANRWVLPSGREVGWKGGFDADDDRP